MNIINWRTYGLKLIAVISMKCRIVCMRGATRGWTHGAYNGMKLHPPKCHALPNGDSLPSAGTPPSISPRKRRLAEQHRYTVLLGIQNKEDSINPGCTGI